MTRKNQKTAKELEAALHRAIGGHQECEGFRVQRIIPLPNSHGIANWDAEFEATNAECLSPECKRALINAKQGIQKIFDLAG